VNVAGRLRREETEIRRSEKSKIPTGQIEPAAAKKKAAGQTENARDENQQEDEPKTSDKGGTRNESNRGKPPNAA